jgi:hypothetical protein
MLLDVSEGENGLSYNCYTHVIIFFWQNLVCPVRTDDITYLFLIQNTLSHKRYHGSCLPLQYLVTVYFIILSKVNDSVNFVSI